MQVQRKASTNTDFYNYTVHYQHAIKAMACNNHASVLYIK